jgi:hypothetical protein
MTIQDSFLARFAMSLAAGALLVSCASSSSVRHGDELPHTTRQEVQGREASREAAEQLLEERAAFQAAAEQYLKQLAMEQRLGGVVVQSSGKDPVIPMYECMHFGCPPTVQCKAAGAACTVTHCGKGSCHTCPMSVPEPFKNLIFKQWCRYECFRGALRLGPVIGFVPVIGGFFVGPLGCEFLQEA